MKEIDLKAMAKINLSLDVVRRREDGYHEVRMIMQTVNLYDEITLKKTITAGINVITDVEFLPTNQDNLVYKAAKLLMDEFQIQEGLEITLKKSIPVAAGMAGGSADAAAVLLGVNELFSLSLSKEQLMERGVKIGADVPYCVLGGTALAEGIGEKLTPLSDAPECYVLIAKPDIEVSTKFVYENLHANQLKVHPDIDGMIEEIQQGSLLGVADKMGNVLETVTVKAYPVIQEIKDTMKQNGAVNSMMSGSGPTVFGLFDKKEFAQRAEEALKTRNDLSTLLITTLVHRG